MYDIFDGERYDDMPVLCRKYQLFPDAKDWEGRIILLETSEEKPSTEKYKKALEYIKSTGLFDAVSGVLVGKPQDETYADEYKKLLVEVINNPKLPILLYNCGHTVSGKCRVVAGYTYEWNSKGQNRDGTEFDIILDSGKYKVKWNLRCNEVGDKYSWLNDVDSVKEVGCIHTCQGLDMNYCGAIIGRDLQYRDGHLFTVRIRLQDQIKTVVFAGQIRRLR